MTADMLAANPHWDAFEGGYWERLRKLLTSPPEGFQVMRSGMYRDDGAHPETFIDWECSTAADMLSNLSDVRTVLDVGSYTPFVLGLAASYDVTSLDVRERRGVQPRRSRVLVSDAKRIDAPDETFDAVVSLCSLEHFGLGRYGDAFDLDADRAAAGEMSRVLRPGGHLILSTTVTRGPPVLWWNAHRVYRRQQIRALMDGLELQEERFFSTAAAAPCRFADVTSKVGAHDVFCGLWRKPDAAR